MLRVLIRWIWWLLSRCHGLPKLASRKRPLDPWSIRKNQCIALLSVLRRRKIPHGLRRYIVEQCVPAVTCESVCLYIESRCKHTFAFVQHIRTYTSTYTNRTLAFLRYGYRNASSSTVVCLHFYFCLHCRGVSKNSDLCVNPKAKLFVCTCEENWYIFKMYAKPFFYNFIQ